jgi:hypothetical protein
VETGGPFSNSGGGQLPGKVVHVRGGPIVAILSLLLGLALIVLLIAIALPVVLIALVVVVVLGAILFAYLRLRLWWRGLRSPNGTLDGRKNVRVRPRNDQETY